MPRLGPFEIESPFVLAPMAGVTDTVFRTLMRRMGAAVVTSELVSCHGMHYGSKKTYDLLRFQPCERPVGLQIFGEEPEALARAAAEIERLGADFVDLNLGCPVPKVTGLGGGAAMLRDPMALERTLKVMRRAISIPLSIKIRTGWDDQEKNAPDCVKAASEAGVAWVTIHGRTREQGYSGRADWDFIARCKAVSGVPVIGNGDVATAEGALNRLHQSGCDAVMIGRGALRNPWIFQEIRAIQEGRRLSDDVYDVVALLKEHRRLIDELLQGNHGAIMLRKFAAWYSHGYPGSSSFRFRVFQARTLDEVERLSLEFFESVRHIPIHSKSTEFFMTSGHG